MEEIDDVLETSAREHAHLRGFSQADREFYVQLEDSDWAFRRSRYQAAMQRDRELGQWLALQWQLYDQAIQALSLAVKTYQGQPRKQVDVRIHVRRCRHGCVCCPHRRLAFFRGGEMLEIPCQTIALRAAGVRTNASLLVSAQRDLMACEDEIRSYYRTVEGFMDRALQRLLIMDRELAAIEYPYYPTPYICPRASGPYTPLPYLLATRFSDWLDDAQMSLSFALLRYATLFVRTKFNRVKQGFFGIHLQKRNSIFSPLYGQFRVYFRGNHGDWFSTNKSIHKRAKAYSNEVVVEPVKIRRRYVHRTGNKSYFYDVRSYYAMHKKIDVFVKRYALSLKKLSLSLRGH